MEILFSILSCSSSALKLKLLDRFLMFFHLSYETKNYNTRVVLRKHWTTLIPRFFSIRDDTRKKRSLANKKEKNLGTRVSYDTVIKWYFYLYNVDICLYTHFLIFSSCLDIPPCVVNFLFFDKFTPQCYWTLYNILKEVNKKHVITELQSHGYH